MLGWFSTYLAQKTFNNENTYKRFLGFLQSYNMKFTQIEPLPNFHPFRNMFCKKTIYFLSVIHTILDLFNKKRDKPISFRDIEHFFQSQFLQYLLISWFWLVSSNSFNILRHLTECHLLQFCRPLIIAN